MKFLAYFCNISCKGKIFFLTFVIAMLLFPIGAAAQEQDNTARRSFDKESFLKKRNAFITAELALTQEEAANFIPLMGELQQKKVEVGRKCRKLTREMRNKQNPTDAEYLEVIDECLAAGVKEAELDKEYYEKFKKILPPKKLYKYREADHKFMHDFMKGTGGGSRERRNDNKNR